MLPLFLTGLVGLFYVYGGYGLILRIAATAGARGAPRWPGFPADGWPSVTVLISALNEAEKMAERIEDLAALDYPSERLEILVVSDGSRDDTVAVTQQAARRYPHLRVETTEFPENRGRHAAQNLAADVARGSIIVTTDADSRFDPAFLRRIIDPFSDPRVGVVGGEKRYRAHRTDVGRSIGLYQRVEYWTRAAEDRWDLMAKTDGPCTAFLKELWDEHEEFEDVDHSIVALAWAQGRIARHATEAICFELPNETLRQEMRARARMTRKGIFTLRKRWPASRALTDPSRTFALYSHRYVRYLSPVFLALSAAGWVGLWLDRPGGWAIASVPFVAAVVPGPLPILGRIGGVARSFLVANWGFAVGIIGALRGDRSGRYSPTHADVR